jgi:dihydroflavonol-4-reductase
MSRVLITGANGHVGANVVRACLAAGHDVVGFVRHGSDQRGIEGLPIALSYGDIRDPKAVEAAVRGCDSVMHLAAVFNTQSKDPDIVVRPAVEGAENVLRAGAACGVSRVVYTSSVAAIGFEESPDKPRTGADWNDKAAGAYYVAKTRSERRAWELAESLSVPMVVLNPSSVVGQYDYRVTPSTRYIVQLLNGIGITIPGGMSYVDVRDVADAHVRALERGVPGERYPVSGANLTFRELSRAVTGLTGVCVPHLPLPRWAIGPAIGPMEWVMRLVGQPPLVTRDEVREVLGRYVFVDTRRTCEALGMTFRPPSEFLDHTIRWIVYSRFLRASVARRLEGRFKPDPEWTKLQP